jgi:predicted nucleotidyltransferase
MAPGLLPIANEIWHNTTVLDAALIDHAAQALLAACPAGSQVILFGSQARGDARARSDVDFLVIEPQVCSRLAEAARLARAIRSFRIPADIVVIARDDFEQWKDAPNTVFYHAHREGRRIA